MKIRELFKNKLFIPYITCGDPTLAVTKDIVKNLAARGADVIELGIPFSDPIADGATNQLAAMRALKNKVNVRDCCDMVHALREEGCDVPIILFTYFNPLYKYGLEEFARLARRSHVDAVLILDLPLEELSTVAQMLQAHDVGIVMLITPTTSVARIQASLKLNPVFLYYVSRTGVTGVSQSLPHALGQELAQLKQLTDLPVAVGFGISTPEQAAQVARMADGVIVGSALVKQLEHADVNIGVNNLYGLADAINRAIKNETVIKL